MLGTNDLRNRWAKPEEEVTADQMIAGLQQLAVRAQAARHQDLRRHLDAVRERDLPARRLDAGSARRSGMAVNAWIREGGAFDAVVDFDLACATPSIPARMLPVYDCGDHLHPSDPGYNKMGDTIDLSLFD